jgi:hypothetical protein
VVVTIPSLVTWSSVFESRLRCRLSEVVPLTISPSLSSKMLMWYWYFTKKYFFLSYHFIISRVITLPSWSMLILPPCCLCASESLTLKFWMPDPVYIKLGMYNMTREPVSTENFLNPSRQSVSVCASLLSFLGSFSVYIFPPQCVIVQLCRWRLCIPLSLLGNNSVKTFSWQQRIVGGVVYYAVRVVSSEIRRLIIPRTSLSPTLSNLWNFVQ